MKRKIMFGIVCVTLTTCDAAQNGRYKKKVTYVDQDAQNTDTQDSGQTSSDSGSQTSTSGPVSQGVPPSPAGSYRGMIMSTQGKETVTATPQPPMRTPPIVPVG